MRKVLQDVKDFHDGCGIPVAPTPSFPADDRVDLRNKLLTEEYNEYFRGIENRDIVEVADALADMVYIIAGTALEFGIPLDRVWDEVQRSNMTKIDPVTGQVRRRSDGKIQKPDGWQPPNIKKVMFT